MTTNDETSTSFQNDQVSVTLVKKPGCLIQADIAATPLAAQAAYEQAIKAVNKEVSLPGFRKGKAPAATILKQFGQIVEKEWRDIILNTSFHELLQLTNIYPFSKSSVQRSVITSLSKEDGAIMNISYECAPNIPVIDPAAITIKEEAKKAVTDEEIEEAIKNFQLMHAEWKEVADRPAVEGDFVYVDINTLDNPQKEVYKDHKVELKHGRLDEWLRRILIGMNVGESREGASEPNPTDSQEVQAEFVPTNFNITVKKIEIPVLPPVDAELANRFGKESVEEFKESIISLLNKQAEDDRQQTARRQIEEAVLDCYHFDVPGSLVKEDLAARKEAITNELKGHGLQGAALKAALKNMESDLEKRVERDLRMLFITQEVARTNKLTVVQEEIMEEFMQQMYLSGSGNSIIHKGMEPAEVRSKLHVSILMRKALDFLRENANTVA